METAHHFFIQTWLQKYSRGPFFNSAYCSLSSAIFLNGEVSTHNDPRKDLHKLCQTPRKCQCKWLLVSSSAPRTFARSFQFPEKLLFCTDLYHDCVSVIVSRFTSFTKNFVICCCQVTNIFCSRYGLASAFSAKSPSYLGLLANVAVSVLREVSVNTVLTRYHFSHRLWSWFMRRAPGCVSVFRDSFVHKILLNSCNHSGRSCNGFRRARSVSSFLFGFSVSVGSGDRSPCACALDGMEGLPNPAVTMLEMYVWTSWKSRSINQGQRSVRSFPCC